MCAETPKYFASLQCLRGIFAIFIFFHHFKFTVGGRGHFDVGGDMGVAFFFILSGFVLSQSQEFTGIDKGKVKIGSIAGFVARRMSKVYPLHVLCLIISIYISRSVTLPDLFNLLLLQSWIPSWKWYYSGNPVGWCLSDFLFFYCIFPLLFKAIRQHRKVFVGCYAAILTIYLTLIVPAIPDRLSNAFIYINPLTRLLDFILGMLLWEYLKSRSLQMPKGNPVLLLIMSIALLVLTIAVWYLLPSKYNMSVLWWPSLSILIMLAVTTCNKLLSIRYLVKFGNFSFSFYMVHVLALKIFGIIIDEYGILLNPIVKLVLFFSSIIIVSYIIHRLFVIPMERLIRNALFAPSR